MCVTVPSQCTVTCGRGLRYRVVLCIDHRGQHVGGCSPSLKPHVKEDCLVPVACHKPRGGTLMTYSSVCVCTCLDVFVGTKNLNVSIMSLKVFLRLKMWF